MKTKCGKSIGSRLALLAVLIALSTKIDVRADGVGMRRRAPDFNGDRMDDLAVGIPGHSIRDSRGVVRILRAGAVNIFYGAYRGFGESADLITQDGSPLGDIAGEPEPDDQFGNALAWGDFNNDGCSDLAVGVPYEDVGSIADAGVIHVIYGSIFGLVPLNNQLWYQGVRQGGVAIKGAAEEGDHFGDSLVVGDFNNDGYDDLAIGVPGEEVSGNAMAGAVNVIYGSPAGLTAAGQAGIRPENQMWHQGMLEGALGTGDRFGYALAAGDFDEDGDDDLAVGVPWDDVGNVVEAGSVNLIFGSSLGLTEQGNIRLHQDRNGMQGNAETGDLFGYALAAGDFTGAGYTRDALAIGIPGEDLESDPGPCFFWSCLFPFVEGWEDAGAVQVVYGGHSFTNPNNAIFHENTEGIPGSNESFDRFGSSLAAGDFNGDLIEDLAIGVVGQDSDGIRDSGKVTVLYGGRRELSTAGSQSWSQASLLDQPEEADGFGWKVTTGDFNHDGLDDLAVAAWGENLEGIADRAGVVNVIFGSGAAHALDAAGNKLLVKLTSLWLGPSRPDPRAGDYFGGY